MKQDLIKKLEEQHFSVEEGRLCQNALNVKGSRLLDTEMYKLGMFTPQDESSMLVAEKLIRSRESSLSGCMCCSGRKDYSHSRENEQYRQDNSV